MSMRAQAVSSCMRNPALRSVELCFLVFSAAEQAVWIGTLVFAYRAGGVVEAGLVAGIQLLPAMFASPWVALAGDRWRRDLVVAASFSAQALCMALTVAAMQGEVHRLVVYVACAMVCVALACTRPAVSALLPAVARDPRDLAAANAAISLFDNCGSLVGPLLAAVCLSAGGPPAVFLVSSAAMAAASLALLGRGRQESAPDPPRVADPGGFIESLLGGVRFLRRDANAFQLVLCVASPAIALGALDVLLVAAASELLGEADHTAGTLLAAFGCGGLVGAAAAISLIGSRRLLPSYALGTLVLGVPLVARGAVDELPTALALLFLAGVGESFAGVCGMTLIQRTTPDRVRGRVFGLFEGLYMAGLSLGALGVSATSKVLGLGGTLVAAGLLSPAVLIISLQRLRRVDAAAHPSRTVVLGTLGGDPILALLPEPSKQRLAQRASILNVARGAFVTREGEAGDRYYSLLEGELEVRIDGRVVRTLRPGDSLGEIALLREIPRTASVVARVDSRLLAVESGDFLEAVGDDEASRARAESLVRERLGER